ncbi:MAG: signal peptidase I [Verrucomicrobia bacterium]|nr:signal peptidase I [Verrucomicrobiota bacterium]
MKDKKKIIVLAGIAAVLAIAMQVFAKPFRVRGDCMAPAINDGQWCFVNRAASWSFEPVRGEIVMFDHETKTWVSRVVAVAGDEIQIDEGSIAVNGKVLTEKGVERDWTAWRQGSYAIDQPCRVPPGHMFVLSDKLSAQSDDSRVFGPIKISRVVGRPLFGN